MNNLTNIISLFLTLLICVLNGYSMMNYRVSTKRAYTYFASISVLCFAVNSCILMQFDVLILRNMMLFTIGLPYLLLILFITEDTISQTFFTFWLWINIYNIITTLSAFISDYTLEKQYFLNTLRLIFLCIYFVWYNKCLKARHKAFVKKLKINWWIFSFIPMFFTILIWLVNYNYKNSNGFNRNYPVLFVILTLMLLVYVLIFYTFQNAHTAMEKQKLTQSMKEQLLLQKKQYEFYLQKAETEKIFRHDARHRDSILLNYLENNDIEAAKIFLDKELTDIQNNTKVLFCENALVNAVLTEYQTKAHKKGIEFITQIQIPDKLVCDEIEFCVMLSNLLENSLKAAKNYIHIKIKNLNSQLSLNIKNDYCGKLEKGLDGWYISTKQNGSGLGLKSVDSILKNNCGFMEISDKNGEFNVIATFKN